MKYKIYQLPIEHENVFIRFKSIKKDVDINDYNLVWEDDEILENSDIFLILDYLFQQYNINHPLNYKGRSLSVSDIVELNGDKYYCDSCGWVKI